MVFMIEISISKDECVLSSEELGQLAHVIILQLTEFNTTNIIMKSKVLTKTR